MKIDTAGGLVSIDLEQKDAYGFQTGNCGSLRFINLYFTREQAVRLWRELSLFLAEATEEELPSAD